MKRLISFMLILCVLLCTFSYARAEEDRTLFTKYVEFAKTQLGKTGAYYHNSNGINFDWCAWFTTFCAFNIHVCGSLDKPSGSIFPPLDRNAWESCNWAATGVTYQANWFMQNDKGEVYKFTSDSRLQSNAHLHNVSPSDVIPCAGDLIYFDWKQDRSWDHVAIVTDYDENTGEIFFIGGNQGESKDWRECAVTESSRKTTDAEYAGLMKIDWTKAVDLYDIPTESVNAIYRIKSDSGVKFRQGCGLSYGMIDILPDKTEVFVTEKTTAECNGYIWGRTEYRGNIGWFAMKYSEFVEKLYCVTFCDWDDTVLKADYLRKGANATPPSEPSRIDYRFIGWDKPFNNVNGDMKVKALYEKIAFLSGDANGDAAVNTGDAAAILRYSADMSVQTFSTSNADYSGDGKVNTGDAALILKLSSGVINNP